MKKSALNIIACALLLAFCLSCAPAAHAAQPASSGLSGFFRDVSEGAARVADEWDAYVEENGDPFEGLGDTMQEARDWLGAAKEEVSGALGEARESLGGAYRDFRESTGDWIPEEDWAAVKDSFRAFRRDVSTLLSDLYDQYGKTVAEDPDVAEAVEDLREVWGEARQDLSAFWSAFRAAWSEARAETRPQA